MLECLIFPCIFANTIQVENDVLAVIGPFLPQNYHHMPSNSRFSVSCIISDREAHINESTSTFYLTIITNLHMIIWYVLLSIQIALSIITQSKYLYFTAQLDKRFIPLVYFMATNGTAHKVCCLIVPLMKKMHFKVLFQGLNDSVVL